MAVRGEGYPSLTARRHWGRYLAGIAVEAGLVIAMTSLAFLLAVIAMAIW